MSRLSLTTQPEPQGPIPEVDDILRLAAIIREVDGNHDKGAAALAEAILSHPDSRWQHAQPLEDPGDACARIELVVALHCLASHFEIACTYLSGDDLTKARGDIAHALSIARKHNQNGPGCPTTPRPVPVAERLPGPEDVNDDGEVWVEEPAYDYPLGDTGDYDSEPGRWVLRPLSSLDKRFKRRWLPHWALPVPQEGG
jgi:hypothetical protein